MSKMVNKGVKLLKYEEDSGLRFEVTFPSLYKMSRIYFRVKYNTITILPLPRGLF